MILGVFNKLRERLFGPATDDSMPNASLMSRIHNQLANDSLDLSAIIDFDLITLDDLMAALQTLSNSNSDVIPKLYSQSLLSGFTVLFNSNMPFETHKLLYQSLIRHCFYAETLAQAFNTLHHAGLIFEFYPALYHMLIKNHLNARILVKGIIRLANAGYSFEEYPEMYNLIERASYSTKVAKGFIILNTAGLTLDRYREIYLNLANYPYAATINAADFVKGIKTLQEAHFDLKDYETLYLVISNLPSSANKVAKGFKQLKEAGFVFEAYADLYHMLADNFLDVEKLVRIFILLNQAGAHSEDQKALYLDCPKHPNLKILSQLVSLMINCNIPLQYFSHALLHTHYKLCLQFLTRLNEAGINFQSHPIVYNAVLSPLTLPHGDCYTTTKIVNEICDYINNNPVFDNQALSKIIEANSSTMDTLLQGPLLKSTATQLIEQLLEEICNTNIDKNQLIQTNQMGHYIVTIPRRRPINLSLLLLNANLSQIELSESLIDKIGRLTEYLVKDYIKQNLPNWLRNRASHPVISLLPRAQRAAIAIYVGKPYYININKLFRSEPLSTSDDDILCTQTDQNYLVCFLLGCLLNDAARKMHILIDSSELKTQLERHHIYDRGEMLSEETIAIRKANPWFLPNVTSVSAFENGSPCSLFQLPGMTRTVVINNPYYGIINDEQREVLIPQGECFFTSQSAEGLVSVLIRSLSFERKNHYWSMLALLHAYDNYLSKEYQEMESAITLQDKQIVRPNHDMSHTYRVMQNIEQVINYFKDHAADPDFKDFCENLTDSEIEWLRIAAAFSITGRESEIAPKQNLVRYEQYRAASCRHFNDFVSTSSEAPNLTMQARLSDVIQYSSPYYEAETNNHPNLKERQVRNFYHRLLTIAHKLDLPRCYNTEQYSHALELCRDLSLPSLAQQNAYNDLIRYNIEMIKAHGCQLFCDITSSGELINVRQDYQNKFAEASTNLNRLITLTQGVRKHLRSPPVASTNERTETLRQPKRQRNKQFDDTKEVMDETLFSALPNLFFISATSNSNTSSSSSSYATLSTARPQKRSRCYPFC